MSQQYQTALLNRSRALWILRIAFSALCSVACVLLIALWVRSYSQIDSVQIVGGHRFGVYRGKLFIDESFNVATKNIKNSVGAVMRASHRTLFGTPILYVVADARESRPQGVGTTMPFWPLTIAAAISSLLPWFPKRFSLRTLLIVTTLVAAVLGLIAWSMR
jgi:hypothetical protein